MYEQSLQLLDPTSEQEPLLRAPLARPVTLAGLTVGLLDISKARGNVFIDRLEQHLNASGIATRRYRKPTFTRPAPVALQQQLAAECDVIIEALAD